MKAYKGFDKGILKPGKVERRKFVCSRCGCEFVAGPQDAPELGSALIS